jgi:hypothetical protein
VGPFLKTGVAGWTNAAVVRPGVKIAPAIE